MRYVMVQFGKQVAILTLPVIYILLALTVTLGASQTADFQLNATPSTQTVTLQGQTASYNVNVVAVDGFNSTVSLTVSGLPDGANGVFSVPEAKPSFVSILLVTLPSNPPDGSFTLTITGEGGGITHATKVLLTVNQEQQGPSIAIILSPEVALRVVLIVCAIVLVLYVAFRRGFKKPLRRV